MTQISIPEEEKQIINLLATGHNYEEVQEFMEMHYPTDYSGKKLGYKVSETQRKLGIKNRVELGYKFCYDECNETMRNLTLNHGKELSRHGQECYTDGFTKASIELSGKDKNKGLMVGVISASLFWCIIFLILLSNGII